MKDTIVLKKGYPDKNKKKYTTMYVQWHAKIVSPALLEVSGATKQSQLVNSLNNDLAKMTVSPFKW